MSGLDTYIKDNPLPSEEVDTPADETSIPKSVDTDLSWIQKKTQETTTTTQWEVERDRLKTELDGTNVLKEFSPEEMNFCGEMLDQNADKITGLISTLNQEIESAADLSKEEIIVNHWNLTLTWEFKNEWAKIEAEVARIVKLEENEAISLTDSASWDIISFDTKREALLYLYYQKLTYKRSQECMDSIDTSSMSEDEKTSWLRIGWIVLLAYIWFNTFTTLIKKINFTLLSTWFLTKFTSGQEMNVSPAWAEWDDAVLSWELSRRREASALLDYVTQGNDNFGSANLPNDLVLDNTLKNSAKDNLWWRFMESLYWRELHNQAHHNKSISWSRVFNTTMKLWNNRISSKTIKYLQTKAETKNSVLKQLFQTTSTQEWEEVKFTRLDIIPGSEGILIKNFRAYMDLSHEVWNTDEVKIREAVNKLIQQIENGDMDFIFNAKSSQVALTEIKQQLFEAATWKKASKKDLERVFWDGTSSNPWEWARLLAMEIKPSELEISVYEEWISAREIEAFINWESYDTRSVKAQLQDFFNSVGSWPDEHRYNFKTASVIIELILSWKTKDEAIAESEKMKWKDVDAKVQARTYLRNIDALLITDLEWDLIARANAIWSLKELQDFDRGVMNLLVWHDGKPKNKIWENVVRSLNTILSDKKTQGLPDTRSVPTPAATTNPTPAPASTAPEAALMSESVFDSSWNLNSDAKTILDWNLTLHILDGGSIEERRIDELLDAYKANGITIWDMITDLEWLNGPNVVSDIERANRIVQKSLMFEIQDVVERWLLMAGTFPEDSNVTARLSDNGSKVTIDIQHSWVTQASFESDANYDALENKLKSEFDVSWDILDWESLLSDPDYSYIDKSMWEARVEKLWFLKNIEDFLRRAR